ncbi:MULTISPECIES: M48 family metallopeptidase [unclassified Legionella]|uniref:M48 family metallopeptidase n=1 Tax=unclassified Legionella TaxID=2622702 RepID=UPI001E6060A0|nr:SprT family zinc-dependent metalloprotease [Legionella sp. 31fI33]MCC5015053.1 M48 family metallopeptidase [Legionella sp. 31fI33]
MSHNQLEIDGIVINIIRKPIKNIHLRIYPPHGEVRVSVPLRFSMALIHRQLEAKSAWIHAQRARLTQNPPPPSPRFETGEHHYFLGKSFAFVIHENSQQAKIVIDDRFIHCFTKADSTVTIREVLLKSWYREQMKAVLPQLLQKWEPIIGVNVNSWGIKLMKTRWGSCNVRAQRIWLNLNLIKKPLACLEYVLVHEMVHLLEASHNKRFHALMTRFMPQWRDYQKQLENPLVSSS